MNDEPRIRYLSIIDKYEISLGHERHYVSAELLDWLSLGGWANHAKRHPDRYIDRYSNID